MKLLLVIGMMCIVCGFPMLRNIKEYDGEIILYYNENSEIDYAIEKCVKVYEEEIGNIVFKVGMTSNNIELNSTQSEGISCKKRDLYYECSYSLGSTDDMEKISINLTVKNLTLNKDNNAENSQTGQTEQQSQTENNTEYDVEITNFITKIKRITKCSVKKETSNNTDSEGIEFTVSIEGKDTSTSTSTSTLLSINPLNIKLISTTPQTYISCGEDGSNAKCTLYNSEHTGNVIRYFSGKEYVTCEGDDLSTGSQFENNHSTLLCIPNVLLSLLFLLIMI